MYGIKNQLDGCSTSYATPSSNVTELNTNQVEKLKDVLNQTVEIHGRENFPTLEIILKDLIKKVKKSLLNYNVNLKCIKLNGGAATHVLATNDFTYSDLDLIFPITLKSEEDFNKVRDAVFDSLLSLMPIQITKDSICADTLKDVYISKMVKVCNDDDKWSLFSLHNDYGKCIELKFVDKMRRQFEFSVDSFQITLDKLLDDKNDKYKNIIAESMYGDIRQALYHLNRKLIDTRNPEEIRGGGLLKYCHLLTRGYQATQNCREMEKYMCSRFFIDFSDIQTQDMKLRAYLDNHFGNDYDEYSCEMKLDYLLKLHRTIKESTICLMGHERRQTLLMVDRLRNELECGLMCQNNYSIACSRTDTPSSMSSPAPPSTVSSSYDSRSSGRSTLLYLPPNSNFWVPVV